jgi:hypothetical protein
MDKWFKIEDDIFISVSNEHQFTIDNKWTTSCFTMNIKYNPNYLIKLIHFYENKISFDWEDNRSRGYNSSIKFFDIYNDSLTITIRSNHWDIKDKLYERNLRLDELLPEDKTYDNNEDIKQTN